MIQRHRDRQKIIYYLRVFDDESDQLIGQVSNITENGIQVIGDHRVEVGKAFKLRILLPKDMKGIGALLVMGSSRYNKPENEPGFFATGFQFVDLSPGDKTIIDKLIQDYFYVEPEEDKQEMDFI